MTVQQIKQRFGIIGNAPALNRAIETAVQVAPTDLSVFITGESGTGKEVMPQIIHQMSSRKHGPYIAVNCGAIPEGTIDSELFGHEKGAFTGATESRKGYFEVADGGTIFLDEVADLPLQTQVRLLRVLETGEYIRVGSSKVQKTDVRVVAATNVNLPEAISNGKFREDLFYRLNTVPISIPSLRERKDDIYLLFRKFASDFAEKYRMPPIRLDESAQHLLNNNQWQGNIRQLKNLTEQISVIEQDRDVNGETLLKYLPSGNQSKLPVLFKGEDTSNNFTERELLYKVLFDMKKDLTDLKKLVLEMIRTGNASIEPQSENAQIIQRLYDSEPPATVPAPVSENQIVPYHQPFQEDNHHEVPIQEPEEIVEESLSLADKEKEMIQKALDKYKGKRKYAAQELGISERTLYRKINEYNLK